MPETNPHPSTVDDLLALPPDETVQVELIDGILYTSPRPRMRHGVVQFAFGSALYEPYGRGRGGPGGWWFAVEPLVRFSRYDAVAPDIAGWHRDRLPELPAEVAIPVVPDWICEVLSPTTALRDRTAKMRLYARSAVGHLWVVDPALRTLEAFRNADGRWLHLGTWTDGDTVPIEPFVAVAIDVGALFPPKPPDIVAEGAPEPWSAPG